MAYLAFALMVLGGLASGTFLAYTGHPWLAALVFLLTGCMSLSAKDPAKKRQQDSTARDKGEDDAHETRSHIN